MPREEIEMTEAKSLLISLGNSFEFPTGYVRDIVAKDFLSLPRASWLKATPVGEAQLKIEPQEGQRLFFEKKNVLVGQRGMSNDVLFLSPKDKRDRESTIALGYFRADTGYIETKIIHFER